LLYLALLTLLGLVVYQAAPLLAHQVDQLATGAWLAQFQWLIVQWQAEAARFPGLESLLLLPTQLGTAVQAWLGQISRFVIGLGNTVLSGVLVLAMAYFLAVDPNTPRRLLFDLLPRPYHRRVYHWLGLMAQQVIRWAWSQALLSLYIVVLYGGGLYLLGVPNTLFLALLAGFLETIPYLGGIATTLVAVLLTLPYSPFAAVSAVVWYVIVNTVENYVLVPRLYQRTMHLHPLLVLLAFLAGGQLFGLIGVVLAVPLAAAIQAGWEHRDRVLPTSSADRLEPHHDPVCGMRLIPNLAHSSLTEGDQTLYFCSDRCQQLFLAWPVDPVCHQRVMPGLAEQVTYQGRTYYFADPECARRFAQAPDGWLTQAAPG
jgi:predicted PurR-regulated permease PerM/YHS domain-containing protein